MQICGACGACYDDGYNLCAIDGGLLTASFPGPRILGDRYQIENHIDSGAMGIIFRAKHLEIGSTLAIKTLRPDCASDVLKARFKREAQVLGQIKHPNAVLVIDYGVEDRESVLVPYLVTEYLRGETLAQRLQTISRPWSIQEAERIITPLCEAVEEAHRTGVVHRDIKPSNVFLERLRDGSEIVKVLDFGIAKLIRDEGEGSELDSIDDDTLRDSVQPWLAVAEEPASGSEQMLTEKGTMLGTLTYMAPEQLTAAAVSAASDVYAIATLIFRLLTGRLPFEGTQLQIMAQKLQGARPSFRQAGVELPVELSRILEKAFAIAPHARPESVLQLSQSLRESAAQNRVSSANEIFKQVADVFTHLEEAAKLVQGRPANTIAAYEELRDRILRLDASVSSLRLAGILAVQALNSRQATLLLRGLDQLEGEAEKVKVLLRNRLNEDIGSQDRSQYLATLVVRVLRALAETTTKIRSHADAIVSLHERNPDVALAAQNLFGESVSNPRRSIAELASDLCSKNPLAADDALVELLEQRMEELIAAISAGAADPEHGRLLAGLWHNADELLLRELYHHRPGKLRLLPILSKLSAKESKPFGTLASVFRRAENDPSLEVARIEMELERTEPDAQEMLWRCLVLSPIALLRTIAADRVELGDLWTAIAFPWTPIPIETVLFRRVRREASSEYLKVFFFIVRDRLKTLARAISPSREEMNGAFTLLADFLAVNCFHEEAIFGSLLEIEGELRAAASARDMALPDGDQYLALLEQFKKKGRVEDGEIESLRLVPLPVQRKLARAGCFINYFVCHPNEQIALETLLHLLKRDEIVPFLKMPKIHRALLVELTREERFFRKEESRLALLHNPKTPAHVARRFIAFLNRAQLKRLAADKHISGEVRHLAKGYLSRLPKSAE